MPVVVVLAIIIILAISLGIFLLCKYCSSNYCKGKNDKDDSQAGGTSNGVYEVEMQPRGKYLIS